MDHRGVRPGRSARARLLYAAAERRVRWTALADSLGVYLPGYPITTPDDRLAVDLVLDPHVAARKVRAPAAQIPPTSGLVAAMGVDRYTVWVGDESFVEPALHPGAAIMIG